MNEADERAKISGYLSEDSKRKFTLVAGVLGALFLIVEFVGPMVAMFAIMPQNMMKGGRFVDERKIGSSSPFPPRNARDDVAASARRDASEPLVGILLVAYTPDRQRLGDLAARTIVIRTPRGTLARVRSERPL